MGMILPSQERRGGWQSKKRRQPPATFQICKKLGQVFITLQHRHHFLKTDKDLPLYSLQNVLLQSCAFYKELPSKQKNRPNKESPSWFYRTSGSFFYQYVVYMKGGFLTVRRRFSQKNRHQKLKFIFMSCLFYRRIHVHVQCTSFTVCYPARLCESNVYCTN